MRKDLKNIKNKRMSFKGTFARYGTKTNFKGYPEITILLRDITNSSNIVVADHVWFNDTKGFQKVGELKKGDEVEFFARVKKYVKGYVNRREGMDGRTIDYRLSHPTKIKKIGS